MATDEELAQASMIRTAILFALGKIPGLSVRGLSRAIYGKIGQEQRIRTALMLLEHMGLVHHRGRGIGGNRRTWWLTERSG